MITPLLVVGQTIGRVFRALPWEIRAALGVLVVAGIMAWIVDYRAYNRGFAEAEQQWETRLAVEIERQEEANREALRRAEEEIARLDEARRVRDATIERLVRAAREDPGAQRPAVGLGSVQRLNSILD